MADSFRIVHPTTGATLNLSASLSGCFMLIAQQIFVYQFPVASKQHTPILDDPIVLDCQSYAVGVTLLTSAQRGQTSEIKVAGNTSKSKRVKTT